MYVILYYFELLKVQNDKLTRELFIITTLCLRKNVTFLLL